MVQILHYLFVASLLNISAQQNIGKPQYRIKPIHTQQNKGNRLPPLVTALQMRLLMSQFMRCGKGIQIGRLVDSGADNTQNERGINVVT